ncbi:hypothetical protein ABW20_dc0110413 [Dactylellina cionopaga]|nr:hypothetical protein ABW20_dc0110413 [Dactylellina cionopaga]
MATTDETEFRDNTKSPKPASGDDTKSGLPLETAFTVADDLTLTTSACWKQGRQLFVGSIKDKNVPPDVVTKFFAGTYQLQQTIDKCKGIQEDVDARYTTRNASGIGTLLDTLGTVKSIGDIVSDDIATCQMIADACDKLVAIVLATLLYENRYRVSRSGDNIKEVGNLVALELEILQKLPVLVSGILEFTWHIQHHVDPLWFKQDDDVLEAIASAEPELVNTKNTSSSIKETFIKTKEKAKKFGKETTEKARDKGAKLKNSLKEAFTNDLKSKFQDILQLYQELNTTTSIAFQEKVLESVEKMPEAVRLELKNLEGMLDAALSDLEVKLSRVQDTADHIEVTTNETAVVVTKVALDIGEVKAMLSEIKVSAADVSAFETFQRYMNCFHKSSEHEKIVQGLFHKKMEDGATMEKSWFLKLNAYNEWKSRSEINHKLLCLKAKRGHGKTMTLLSVLQDLEAAMKLQNESGKELILLRFFFKLGDAGLQSGMSALESILRQFLAYISARQDSERIRLANQVLEQNGIQKIEAEMQSDEEIKVGLDIPKTDFKTPKLVCTIIAQLVKELGIQIYIVLDALDECEDRKSIELVGLLQGLAYSDSSSGVKILFSTRDEGNIESDFQENNLMAIVRGSSLPQLDIPYVEVVELTKENNAAELHDYLRIKLRTLVERRAGRPKEQRDDTKHQPVGSELRKKAVELADTIQSKVNGDFSYATMVIANLQQPSKKSLEIRIRDLPSDIGEIYRKRLDLLTAEERLLVLFALKWVVWSVSDVTPIEIAEHFREVYWTKTDDSGSELASVAASSVSERELRAYDPSQDPEVREIISHLRHSGHDFFSFNTDTDPIVVHLSVREWVRGGSKAPKLLEKAQAQVTNSLGGEMVFQDPGAENSESLLVDDYKKRYEIRHWTDHVKALQKYWDSKPANNPRWNAFKNLLVKFTESQNWYPWYIQNRLMGRADLSQAYSPDTFQSPIHFALFQGLDLLTELLRTSDSKDSLGRDDIGQVPLVLARHNPETLKYLLDQGAPADQVFGGLTTMAMILYQSLADAERREALLESVKLLARHGTDKQMPEAFNAAVAMALDDRLANGDPESHRDLYLGTAKVIFESRTSQDKVKELNTPILSAIESMCANPDRAQHMWGCIEFMIELGVKLDSYQF